MTYPENTPVRRALLEIQGPDNEQVAHRREILAQDDKELDAEAAQEIEDTMPEQSIRKERRA